MCANLNAIIVDSDAPRVMIIGDFNCQWGTRFFNPHNLTFFLNTFYLTGG